MAHIPEIAGYIQFEYISVSLVVSGTGSDEFVNPVDAIQGSFADSTTVRVVNQFSFYNMIYAAVQQMMDNPVAKIRREDFPFNRLVDNKSNARPWLILPAPDFVGKLKQVVFKVNLEFQLVPGISFVPPSPVVGFKQFKR
ncbi:MAG: hypothetical protein KKA54_12130 [Proteobacteria bacterium]|nr:hypothetical protein [Pseudomonadota bacterium]MBU0967114.1 hypothetical protein [Pseudomonadota bacterium]